MEIKTKADVKRIPRGTKLRILRNLRGPVGDGGRIFLRAPRDYVVLVVDEPGTPHHGRETELSLAAGTSIESRPGGFRILLGGHGVAADVIFVLASRAAGPILANGCPYCEFSGLDPLHYKHSLGPENDWPLLIACPSCRAELYIAEDGRTQARNPPDGRFPEM